MFLACLAVTPTPLLNDSCCSAGLLDDCLCCCSSSFCCLYCLFARDSEYLAARAAGDIGDMDPRPSPANKNQIVQCTSTHAYIHTRTYIYNGNEILAANTR